MTEEVAENSFIDNSQGQFQNFFRNLNMGKKIFLFASIAAILLGLVVFAYFSQRITWTTLVSGVDPQDAGRIVEKLKELDVESRLRSGGRTILVPDSQVDNVRLQVASSGLRIGGVVGLESFDKNDFSTTEFQQRVRFRRALEGELTRLITKINIISSAKVSIAIPEKTLFPDQERNPTASVVLELSNNKRLSKRGITTILNLVSGAVPGMTPKEVRIADQNGNLLSKGAYENAIDDIRDKNYAYRQIAEQRLEQKLVTQLESIVGKDRAKVRISLQLDFDNSDINVVRMSVAVLIDGRYDYKGDETGEVIGAPVYVAWDPRDLAVIEQLAKQTLGFDKARGDTMSVKNIRFRKPPEEPGKLKLQKSETRYKFIADLIRYLVVGLIIILVVFVVIRPVVQKLLAKPEDLSLLMGLPTIIGELEGEELKTPTEKDTGVPPRDKIIEIAKSRPLKTASLIRSWLREKKGP